MNFKRIFNLLPEPENSVFYGSIMRLVNLISISEDEVRTQYDRGLLDGEYRSGYIMRYISLHVLNVVTGIGIAGTSRYEKQIRDTIFMLSKEWKENPVYGLFKKYDFNGSFHEYIPENASRFYTSPILSAEILNQMSKLVESLDNEVVADHLSKIDELQKKNGFNFIKDIWSLLKGKYITLTMPSPSSLTISEEQSVTLFELNDPKKARDKLDLISQRVVGSLNEYFSAEEEIDDSDPMAVLRKLYIQFKFIPFETEHVKFRRKITISIFPMFEPVFGIYKEFLFIASTQEAWREYQDFLEEGKPTILSNPAFSALDLNPPENADGVNFTDKSVQTTEMSTWLNLSFTLLNFIPSESPASSVFREMLNIYINFSTIYSTLDNKLHEATYSIFDKKLGYSRIHTVTTFDKDIPAVNK